MFIQQVLQKGFIKVGNEIYANLQKDGRGKSIIKYYREDNSEVLQPSKANRSKDIKCAL